MSERIRGSYANALYKSTYTLLCISHKAYAAIFIWGKLKIRGIDVAMVSRFVRLCVRVWNAWLKLIKWFPYTVRDGRTRNNKLLLGCTIFLAWPTLSDHGSNVFTKRFTNIDVIGRIVLSPIYNVFVDFEVFAIALLLMLSSEVLVSDVLK